MSCLRNMNKKVKNFPIGKEASFDLDNEVSCVMTPYNEQCTHVLIFQQVDDNAKCRLRSFLCKRLSKGNKCLKALHDLYFSIYDNDSLTCQLQYVNSLLHTLACVLHDCLWGSTFPYMLVHWLAAKIAELECVMMTRLKPGCTWLLGEDIAHWPNKYILSKINLGQRSDTLAMYLSFCRDTFSAHFFRGTKRPRERFTTLSKHSHEEVFPDRKHSG